MNNWKPIKTAIPDCDKPILLFDKKRSFNPPFVGFRVIANREMDDEKIMTMDGRKLNFVDATHWQECPKPPK